MNNILITISAPGRNTLLKRIYGDEQLHTCILNVYNKLKMYYKDTHNIDIDIYIIIYKYKI